MAAGNRKTAVFGYNDTRKVWIARVGNRVTAHARTIKTVVKHLLMQGVTSVKVEDELKKSFKAAVKEAKSS
jgi:hypothetical protein